MDAVVLAGGLGSRLKPFTEVIPKPLLPIGDRSILEHQIACLKKAGVSRVYLATNYKSELIEAYFGDGSRFGVAVTISREQEPLGTAGPLTLLADRLTQPFLVMNGDILTRQNLGSFYETAVARHSILTVATKIITTPFRFGSVLVDEDDRILGVEEKPDFKLEIVAGLYVMQPDIFKFIPRATYFGMDSLIKTLLSNGQPISRFLIEEYWLDIGQVEDYSQARRLYEQEFMLSPDGGEQGNRP